MSDTYLDLNILAVDHLHNTHNIVKNKAQFLAVVCRESDVIKKNPNKCNAAYSQAKNIF